MSVEEERRQAQSLSQTYIRGWESLGRTCWAMSDADPRETMRSFQRFELDKGRAIVYSLMSEALLKGVRCGDTKCEIS